jgi:HSP20 family molecular chaperone IbpA
MRTPLNFMVNELQTGLVIEIDVPGVVDTDIELSVDGNQLVLAGKRLGVPFGQNITFSLMKYDPSTVAAELQMGVLTVTMDPRPDPGVIDVPIAVVTSSLE